MAMKDILWEKIRKSLGVYIEGGGGCPQAPVKFEMTVLRTWRNKSRNSAFFFVRNKYTLSFFQWVTLYLSGLSIYVFSESCSSAASCLLSANFKMVQSYKNTDRGYYTKSSIKEFKKMKDSGVYSCPTSRFPNQTIVFFFAWQILFR